MTPKLVKVVYNKPVKKTVVKVHGNSAPQDSKLFRVLHDYEIAVRQFKDPRHGQFYQDSGDWAWRAGDPEVFWMYGGNKVPFDERWQMLSYAMNLGMNPGKWRIVYADDTAFMNRTGFWEPDSPYQDRHVQDFVNGVDVSPSNPLPEFDKVRVCGGATIRGIVDGQDVIVETMKYGNCPTLSWLNERPWLYFHALIEFKKKADGSPVVYPFTQNGGSPVLIPLVAKDNDEIRFPLGALQEVFEIADPYRIYIQ